MQGTFRHPEGVKDSDNSEDREGLFGLREPNSSRRKITHPEHGEEEAGQLGLDVVWQLGRDRVPWWRRGSAEGLLLVYIKIWW